MCYSFGRKKLAGQGGGMGLKWVRIVTGDLEENCGLLWKDGQREAIVFDPGDEAEKIDRLLKKHGLAPAAFVQTHCHGDHIGALTPLKALYPATPIYCPSAEVEWLQRPTLNLSYFYGVSITAPRPERLVNDGDVIEAAGLTLKAIHVPGHSPGGTAYFVEDDAGSPPHLFCGDILFAGGIGRTDLPGGEGEHLLVGGIQEKLFRLPENTIVHPGHGPDTTIGTEKESNPYCGL
jgi:glyoxylase-like metal-dependent hydrolase (beta-lactamase superfamily II)